MKRTIAMIMLGSLLATFLGDSASASTEYSIDANTSFVVFKVKNRDIAYVVGRFNGISGTINAVPMRKPSKLEINAQVETKSVDTNNRKRDGHLKGQGFFDTNKHPTISFTTKSSKQLKNDMFELTGNLSMLRIVKEITLTFELIGYKQMRPGVYRLGVQSEFVIKRSDFGMTNMIPGIADEVEVSINLEAKFVQTLDVSDPKTSSGDKSVSP